MSLFKYVWRYSVLACCVVAIFVFSLMFLSVASAQIVSQTKPSLVQASKIDVKSYPMYDLLPAGTLIALKSADLENPAYVYFDGQRLTLKPGNFAQDPHCHFFVMRGGDNNRLFGFKISGWNNMYDDAASSSVRIGKKSENFSDQTEQWVIKPQDPSRLNSVTLQNFGTGRFLYFAKQGQAQGSVLSQDAVRLEIEVIKQVPDDINPGGSSFSFIPAVHKKNRILFHETWSFTPGKLRLLIKVAGENNIFIILSPEKKLNPTAARIMIGQEGNTVTSIFVGDKKLFEATKEPQSLVTTPENSSFWVTLDGSEMNFGKGKEIGVQPIARIDVDEAVAKNFKYIGFGGGGNPLSFNKIVINPESQAVSSTNPEPHTEKLPQPEPQPEQTVVPAVEKPVMLLEQKDQPAPAKEAEEAPAVIKESLSVEKGEPVVEPNVVIKKRPKRSFRGKKQSYRNTKKRKAGRPISDRLRSSQRIRAALKKKPALIRKNIEGDDNE